MNSNRILSLKTEIIFESNRKEIKVNKYQIKLEYARISNISIVYNRVFFLYIKIPVMFTILYTFGQHRAYS